MPLTTKLDLRHITLEATEERRISHHLETLGRRLVHRPEPIAVLALTGRTGPRRVEADLRVELGPLGMHLISHQHAETADHAVRLAVEDVERQLERQTSQQRGEAAFGVPSRREPRQLRPNPPGRQPPEGPAPAEESEAAAEPPVD